MLTNKTDESHKNGFPQGSLKVAFVGKFINGPHNGKTEVFLSPIEKEAEDASLIGIILPRKISVRRGDIFTKLPEGSILSEELNNVAPLSKEEKKIIENVVEID